MISIWYTWINDWQGSLLIQIFVLARHAFEAHEFGFLWSLISWQAVWPMRIYWLNILNSKRKIYKLHLHMAAMFSNARSWFRRHYSLPAGERGRYRSHSPCQESKPTFIGTVGTAVSGNADENVHIRKAVGGRNWPYPGTSGTWGRRLKSSAPTAHFWPADL